MSSFPGDNVTYTAENIVHAAGNIIIRSDQTALSTDTMPSATDLRVSEFGDVQGLDHHMSITIINTGAYPINQSMGTGGLTLIPASSFTLNHDTILVGQSKTYSFIFTSNTTADVYSKSSSSGTINTGIPLTDGTILIGDVLGQAAGVSISGELTLTNSGVATLGSSIAGVTKFESGIVSEAALLLQEGVNNVALTVPTTLSNSYILEFPDNQGLVGNVLVNDGSGVMTWENMNEYFHSNGPVSAVTITDTAAIVVVDESVNNSNSNFNNAGGRITVDKTGNYKITYNACFTSLDESGGGNATFASYVSVNATEVIGSRVYVRMSEQPNEDHIASAGKSIILPLTAGDIVDLRSLRDIGTTSGRIAATQNTVTIERLM